MSEKQKLSNDHKPRFTQTTAYNKLNLQFAMDGIFRGINCLNSILDIGCGYAHELQRIEHSSKNLVGVDIQYNRIWKSLPKINFVIADAHHLPFKEEVFQFVFFKDMLHHISQDKQSVVTEAIRVCEKSGHVRIIEANRYHINPLLVYKSDNAHDHFTKAELEKLAKKLSFDQMFGYEQLPCFSSKAIHFPWNCLVGVLFACTFFSSTKRFLVFYIKFREYIKSYTTYLVIDKSKFGR